MLNIEQRLQALRALGESLQQPSEAKDRALQLAESHNGWFTKANSRWMLESIAQDWLQESALREWMASYPDYQEPAAPQRVGLVLAGNLPAVGLHDVLSVFMAGHIALLKYSEKDNYLIPFVLEELAKINPETAAYFVPIERLTNFDKVIATGSNNSAVYFDQYFKKYPHIIRRHRNSVAVLDGNESDEQLKALGVDIFRYFGLGCRSVSKIYVPEGYDFPRLMEKLDLFQDVMEHTKYRNNFEYNRSLLLINSIPHYTNDCIMLREDGSLFSRIATLHYQFYSDINALKADLKGQLADAIQCIATDMNLFDLPTVRLGATQSPRLWDYADGVDVFRFLLSPAEAGGNSIS